MRNKPEWLEAKEEQSTSERGYLAQTFFKQAHCPLCKHSGKPRRTGWSFASILLLMFLLLCWLVPGLIYLVYRSNKAAKLICAQCKSEYIVRI